jgi:cob(I)alamin adenosyltransferase
MKIYTRTGDKGQTSLIGGERVSKNHARVAAYGLLDELNSYLGLCAVLAKNNKKMISLSVWIENLQFEIFALGSWLASKEACENVVQGRDAFSGKASARTNLKEESILALENAIDEWEKSLTPMKSFILPGGSELGASLHYARTLCRHAERETIALRESGEVVPELAIRYLNRLADALFVAARFANKEFGVTETPWL